jgi:hypothetical protein
LSCRLAYPHRPHLHAIERERIEFGTAVAKRVGDLVEVVREFVVLLSIAHVP